MNPLNVLIDVIPAKYRKFVYALVALLSLGYSIWQAADGNWGQVIGALLTSLTTTTAAVNTDTADLTPAGVDPEPDEVASYEALGGLPYDSTPEPPSDGQEPDRGVPSIRDGVSGNTP